MVEALQPGALLGDRYRIQGRLGAGGMGEVWRARDEKLDIDIAIKRAHRSDSLSEELKLARTVTHERVCRLHDLVESGDQTFITMELLEGQTLEQRLGEGPLEPVDVLRTLLQIAQGLEAAHQRGVIHRDLKPSNVMLCPKRGAVLLDFGIATARAQNKEDHRGTPSAMAPEQRQRGQADERSDVYAFGKIAQALCVAALDEVLAPLIETCLEEEPDHRLPDGRALVQAIEQLRWAPPERKARWAWPVLLAAVIGAGVLALWSTDKRSPAPEVTILPFASTSTEASPNAHRLVQRALYDVLHVPAQLGTRGTRSSGLTGLAVSGTVGADAASAQVWLDIFEQGRLLGQVHERAQGQDALTAVANQAAEAIVQRARLRPPRPAVRAKDGAYRLWRRARYASLMRAYPRARALAQAALRIDPSFALPYLEIASTHEQDHVQGRAAIKAARARQGALPERWRLEIAVYEAYFAGKEEAIFERAQRLAKLAADDLVVQVRWAELLVEAGEVDQGLAHLERLVREHPLRGAAALRLAEHDLGRLDLGRAQPRSIKKGLLMAQQAARAEPDSGSAAAALAYAHLLSDHRALAVQWAARAVQLEPKALTPAMAAYSVAMSEGDPFAAQLAARRLLLSDEKPIQASGRYLLALVDLMSGRLDRGLEALGASCAQMAQVFKKTAGDCYLNQAWYALQLEDLRRARSALAKALPLGANPHERVLLQRVIDRRERPGPLSFSMPPEGRAPHRLRSALHLRLLAAHEEGRHEEAEQIYRRFDRSAPPDPWVLYAVASAARARGDSARAIQLLQRLVRHAHAWDEPILVVRGWRMLGELHDALGHRERALTAYRRFLSHWGEASRPILGLSRLRERTLTLEAEQPIKNR